MAARAVHSEVGKVGYKTEFQIRDLARLLANKGKEDQDQEQSQSTHLLSAVIAEPFILAQPDDRDLALLQIYDSCAPEPFAAGASRSFGRDWHCSWTKQRTVSRNASPALPD